MFSLHALRYRWIIKNVVKKINSDNSSFGRNFSYLFNVQLNFSFLNNFYVRRPEQLNTTCVLEMHFERQLFEGQCGLVCLHSAWNYMLISAQRVYQMNDD
jgi:hypothetical protein